MQSEVTFGKAGLMLVIHFGVFRRDNVVGWGNGLDWISWLDVAVNLQDSMWIALGR
jgi:hypothetical protein